MIVTARRTAPDIDPRILHINEWQRISERHRDDVLGTNFFNDVRAFYQLGTLAAGPRYRPNIRIPELQVMMMMEANDLSEFQPQAYIYDHGKGSQLQDIEKGFASQWQQMQVPFHLLFGFVGSQFHGTSFLQVGIDPTANQGRGRMWTKCRDPRTCHMDPATDYTLNWSYVILEDFLHLDEIKRRFPENAHKLPKYPGRPSGDLRAPEMQTGFQLPPGPFESMPSFLGGSTTPNGMTSRLRWTLFRDYGRDIIPPPTPDGKPGYKWHYPNGRIIADCENVVIADGHIPWPHGRFNLVPLWATPPLFGPWAVPPTRYTDTLQSLAEKFYAQTYENFWRLNNGVWFIPATAEIDQSEFGGVPGEKQTYEGDKPPVCVTPPAFPAQAIEYPEKLLQKQRELHGFNQARQGNPGDGNFSPELFNAAVLRGQGMTQLRGRLASASVLELSKCIAYAMLAFMPEQKMPLKNRSVFEVVDFKPPELDRIDDLTMLLDDGSFHVKSQAIVDRMTEMLMKTGQLPIGKGLAMIGYPDAEKVGREIEESHALAALASVGKPKGAKA